MPAARTWIHQKAKPLLHSSQTWVTSFVPTSVAEQQRSPATSTTRVCRPVTSRPDTRSSAPAASPRARYHAGVKHSHRARMSATSRQDVGFSGQDRRLQRGWRAGDDAAHHQGWTQGLQDRGVGWRWGREIRYRTSAWFSLIYMEYLGHWNFGKIYFEYFLWRWLFFSCYSAVRQPQVPQLSWSHYR